MQQRDASDSSGPNTRALRQAGPSFDRLTMNQDRAVQRADLRCLVAPRSGAMVQALTWRSNWSTMPPIKCEQGRMLKGRPMSRTFRPVSADGHVNEPPDVWQGRMPRKFEDRAPRMERFEEGHAWIFEGYEGPINFGHNAAASVPPEMMKPWVFWEDVPERSYKPLARTEALDQGGVEAELLYATPRIATGMLAVRNDPEFHVATIRAYNDWLSEFCSGTPARLGGLALMPAVGVDAAMQELDRAMKLPGMKSPYLGRWPNGGVSLTAADDSFWAAAQEMNVPVSIHVSLATTESGAGDSELTALASALAVSSEG
jgi:predicted TIM-barrel fold metal-dependent hydrolase